MIYINIATNVVDFIMLENTFGLETMIQCAHHSLSPKVPA